MALVSRWLPPTSTRCVRRTSGSTSRPRCFASDTWRRETSSHRRDHFCIGRLFQPTRLLYSRGRRRRQAILDGLVGAYRETWAWSRPWLPDRFDAEAYGRSASADLDAVGGPAGAGRTRRRLWEAQRALQLPVLERLLEELADRGESLPVLPGAASQWARARPVGARERLSLELYFRRSIVRSTSRWLKHTVTFEGWLDYILRKANRHTGEPIQLTERERRWPWVFLWGRLFRYLRTKNSKGSPS